MLSSRLFWKLFVSYTVLNLAATVTFVGIVSSWQQGLVVEQIRHRLDDSASLVRSHVFNAPLPSRSDDLQAHVRRLGEEIGTRITLIALDGDVLADSTKATVGQVAEMENHKDRLELVQAAATGHGTSERKSPTIGESMLYVALRVDRDDAPVGFVRTALPMTEVLAQVATIQRLIWLVGFLVSLGVLALTYFVAARVAYPVSLLTGAAEAIAAGNFEHRVYLQTRDELGTLAKSFTKMSGQLEAREAQLRESRQRLATVLDGMVEGVIAIDDQQRIMLANAAAGRLLGFSSLAAEGQPLLEIVRNHAMHNALAMPQDEQGGQRVEIELGGDDNRVVSLNVTMLSANPSTRCILVLHDVTTLRRLESLRQEFVANVSHELKTPLSAIKAYAETLLNGAVNDADNNIRFVHQIEEQADRLHELILDMLSIARIESGQETFEIDLVRVSDVVQSCVLEHQAAADAKAIVLACIVETNSLQVQADEEGLRQIISNLIDNAVKYTPDGGEVAVECRCGKSLIEIDVSDTGNGIEAEFLPRLFERFFRVDKARSREVGGTGLGLSIVKHLAQAFGGSVDVQSEVGKGTVFTVKLPAAADAAAS